MRQDLQGMKLLHKDMDEETEIIFDRLVEIIKELEKPKKVVEPINNECIGDMQ